MKPILKKNWPIITIVGAMLLLHLVGLLKPTVISWDGSVYVGMGKYIFSHGTIGTWEPFRPVLWPIILGFFWKIGINPYTAGIIIELLTSCLLVILLYRLGEHVRKNTGLFTAALFAFLPVFFQYAAIPMTDILSTFCAVGVLFILSGDYTKKRLLGAGIVAGCAFLFRFPQGLILIVGGVIIVVDIFFFSVTKGIARIKKLFIEGGIFIGGFLLIVLPYFIANQYFYHNAFLPLVEGNTIIKGFPGLYHKGLLFYFAMLWRQSIAVIFILPVFFMLKKRQYSRSIVFVLITLCIYIGYFLYQPHKELRYVLAFLPYIFLFVGLGISLLLERMQQICTMVIFATIILIGITTASSQLRQQTGDDPTTASFSAYFSTTPGAHIISSAPFPVMYGDVLIVKTLYNDWQDALTSYQKYRSGLDYVALDSCVLEIACIDDHFCYEDKELFLTTLETKEKKVFASAGSNHCDMRIYKIQK